MDNITVQNNIQFSRRALEQQIVNDLQLSAVKLSMAYSSLVILVR